jgi:hypothetical protein
MRRLWISSTIRSRPSRARLPGRKAKKLRKLLSRKSPGAATRRLRPVSELSEKRRRASPERRAPFRLKPARPLRPRRRPPGKINVIDVGSARNKKSGPFPLRVLRAQRRFKLSNHGSRRYNAARLDAQAKKAASRNLELLDRTMQKVMEVREQLIDAGSQGSLSTPAASPDIVSGVDSAAPPPAVEASQPSTAQELARAALDTPYLGTRKPIGSQRLEAVITEAVKNPAFGCENFVGVIVQRTAPKSPSDANWSIKGVRFGGVDREEAGKALSVVVTRMQQEFSLSED